MFNSLRASLCYRFHARRFTARSRVPSYPARFILARMGEEVLPASSDSTLSSWAITQLRQDRPIRRLCRGAHNHGPFGLQDEISGCLYAGLQRVGSRDERIDDLLQWECLRLPSRHFTGIPNDSEIERRLWYPQPTSFAVVSILDFSSSAAKESRVRPGSKLDESPAHAFRRQRPSHRLSTTDNCRRLRAPDSLHRVDRRVHICDRADGSMWAKRSATSDLAMRSDGLQQLNP